MNPFTTSDHSVEGVYDPNVNAVLVSCHLCPANNRKKFKGQRGLKIHISRRHQSVPSTPEITSETSTDFAEILSNLKAKVRVLKRIPKGARFQAANRLSAIINECLTDSQNIRNWHKLLSFSFVGFRLPDKKNLKGNLTSKVKSNLNIESQMENIDDITIQFEEVSLSRRVESKISDGDIKGAIRLLMSEDSIAPQDDNTFSKLIDKHPPPSNTMNFPLPPDESTPPLIVVANDVKNAISSFTAGSSSGIDGLRPQHLKDLVSIATAEAGNNLLNSVTNLCNFMLSGQIPVEILPIIYGANLCALNKKMGGIRPIAVGNCFRRLTAKLACISVRDPLKTEFQPRQLGFASKAGCETIVHAVRTYIDMNRLSDKVLLLIDFENAFNIIDRDVMLQQVKDKTPHLYHFLWQAYSASSYLFFGNKIIVSQSGCQQGDDPTGQILFCLTINPIISELVSELVLFYLDDGTIAGDVNSVFMDFEALIQKCNQVGLRINSSKCQLFFTSEINQDVVDRFNDISPGIVVNTDLTLLGAPITLNASQHCFGKLMVNFRLMLSRLITLRNKHISYYLLRSCFGTPKLTYLLRSCPGWLYEHYLTLIDDEIKACLENVINNKLDNDRWLMASLPISLGGLGVRRSIDVCLPAFLSSVQSASSLLGLIFGFDHFEAASISHYNEGLAMWNSLNVDSLPNHLNSQHHWDTINSNRVLATISLNTNVDQARHLALQRPESNYWLYALPSRSIGTLLENNHFRICMGLRLGCNLCSSHRCICGEQVFENGLHGLSCVKAAGTWPRHQDFNNIIHRTLNSVNYPSHLEPLGLLRDDNKRPDGMTLVPWKNGRYMTWDARCTHTFAPSQIQQSSSSKVKIRNYSGIIDDGFIFIPVVAETMGPWCDEARKLIDSLGRLLVEKSGNSRAGFFLKQSIGLAIQRGNATSVMSTFKAGSKLHEIFYIL